MTSLAISAANVRVGKWPAQYPGCIGSNGRGFRLDAGCIVEDFTGVSEVRKVCYAELRQSGSQPIAEAGEVVWLRRIQRKGESGRSVMYTLLGEGVVFSFRPRQVNVRPADSENLIISARDIEQENWPSGLAGRGPRDCRSIIRDLAGVRKVRLVSFRELLASSEQPIVGPGEVVRARRCPSGEKSYSVMYTWLGDGVRFRAGN